MKEIENKYSKNTFENIRHIDDYGNEYWYARELSKVLEYRDWRNFLKVLKKAKEACKNSGFNVDEQLVEVNKLSKRNNNAILEKSIICHTFYKIKDIFIIKLYINILQQFDSGF